MPDTLDGLQLILGTDKRNPAFCLYTDATAQALHAAFELENEPTEEEAVRA